MELSRVIPKRRKTVKFRWVEREFLVMSPQYITSRSGMKPLNNCSWCGHDFADGEQMALAQPEKGKNMLLCQSCATEALKED